MNTTPAKLNLLDLTPLQLREQLTSMGAAAFRADQIIQWVHQFGVTDFSQMQNLSKVLREKLHNTFEIRVPEIMYAQNSRDGTRKWLLKLQCGNAIEMVFIPQRGRGTLCISSQVGCALNCSFCSTGKQGFNRHLTLGEIIGQLWVAVRQLSQQDGRHDKTVTNVVMMGMGEPLLNYEPLIGAISYMRSDIAYGLSKYRVTVSTSGIVPEMYRLAKDTDTALAVSLHAPTDELRNELVPVNKRYPIKELMAACRAFYRDEPRRKIIFEYVMLAGVNDQPAHARQLIQLLEREKIPAKINLIPFNPYPGAHYHTSSLDAIEHFQKILIKAGYFTSVRLTRGEDMDAACGQLVGEVNERTKRKQQWQLLMERQTQCHENTSISS